MFSRPSSSGLRGNLCGLQRLIKIDQMQIEPNIMVVVMMTRMITMTMRCDADDCDDFNGPDRYLDTKKMHFSYELH